MQSPLIHAVLDTRLYCAREKKKKAEELNEARSRGFIVDLRMRRIEPEAYALLIVTH